MIVSARPPFTRPFFRDAPESATRVHFVSGGTGTIRAADRWTRHAVEDEDLHPPRDELSAYVADVDQTLSAEESETANRRCTGRASLSLEALSTASFRRHLRRSFR